MDIEKYLQTTEEEVDEEEEVEGENQEDAALGKSASKKHPHIGAQHSLSVAHAWARAGTLLPRLACSPRMICCPGEWLGLVATCTVA